MTTIKGRIYIPLFNQLPRTVQGRIQGRLAQQQLVAKRKAMLAELEDQQVGEIQ